VGNFIIQYRICGIQTKLPIPFGQVKTGNFGT